ncbi:MAG: PEP-CTERM sorting domain-containing protein [Pirellulales bacterium]
MIVNVGHLWKGIALALLLTALPLSVPAAIVLDEPFDSFVLGTTWQATPAGAPNETLAFVNDGTTTYLHMASIGAVSEFRGIETIAPISLAGVASLVVDVRLRPINEGGNGTPSAAEVAVLGASGEFSRAVASSPYSPGAWADSYIDSDGTNVKTDFAHCASGGCDSYRRFVLTIDGAGTSMAAYNADGSLNAFSASNPALTLASYGSEVDIALRQMQVANEVAARGFFDSVTVSTTAIPEPTGMMLLGLGALGLFVLRRRNK